MPGDPVEEANVQAFLRLIRHAEHYPDSGDDTYDVLYGGGRFGSYATHPNRAVTRWGHTSTAAGAYQILFGTWRDAKRRGLVNDFSPAAQDAIARDKLRSRGALPAVMRGDVPTACASLRGEWTSLPGAAQSRMSMAVAEAAFARFGGTKR